MNKQEIIKHCPDTFEYNGEKFLMCHYGKSATHKGDRSDEILWLGSNNTEIYYYKGELEVYTP